MKKYVLEFLKRGALFGGLGPIVAGLVYFILDFTISDFSLSGAEVFVAILSTYALAFLQAGASVFNQIEAWPLAKSFLCHFATIYFAYIGCYLINYWIPFNFTVILIFTAIFAVTYLIIWLSVYFAVKNTSKKFNSVLPN